MCIIKFSNNNFETFHQCGFFFFFSLIIYWDLCVYYQKSIKVVKMWLMTSLYPKLYPHPIFLFLITTTFSSLIDIVAFFVLLTFWYVWINDVCILYELEWMTVMTPVKWFIPNLFYFICLYAKKYRETSPAYGSLAAEKENAI